MKGWMVWKNETKTIVRSPTLGANCKDAQCGHLPQYTKEVDGVKNGAKTGGYSFTIGGYVLSPIKIAKTVSFWKT